VSRIARNDISMSTGPPVNDVVVDDSPGATGEGDVVVAGSDEDEGVQAATTRAATPPPDTARNVRRDTDLSDMGET